MTNQPFAGSAIRGAVDLSALRRGGGPRSSAAQAGALAGPGAGGAGAAPVAEGYVVDATDASFQQLVSASVRYPVVILLWSHRQPASAAFADLLASTVRSYDGRMQLARVDVETNPALVQAFMQGQLPMCVAFLQGRPVPLFPEPQPEEVIRQVLDQLVQVAIQSGVTGRVPKGSEPVADAPHAQEELSETMQRAYAAIDAGDYDAATTAYEQALAERPGDEEARLGLAQVALLRRTDGVAHIPARKAAADNPVDVAAQTLVADLDVLGGHVEDAFARLIDTVRATSGPDRLAAKDHLLGLFDVVGAADPRVIAARKALTAALF